MAAILEASHYTVGCGCMLMGLNLIKVFPYKVGTVGAWLVFLGVCENVIAGLAS